MYHATIERSADNSFVSLSEMENTTLLIIVLTLVPAFVFGLKWKDCGNFLSPFFSKTD